MEQTQNKGAQTPLAEGRWVIDGVHSTVSFILIDSTDLKIVAGRFTDFAGEILVEDGRSTISGSLRTESINTDDQDRDDDLRSSDYLDAAAHPEFRLEVSEINWGETVTIDGSFLLGGSVERVRLEGELIGVGRDGKGNERVALIVLGKLPWGAFEVRLVLGASAIRASA